MAHDATHPFPSSGAQKRLLALRFWLLGARYHRTLRALEVNERLFSGVRKDGTTPEFDHHVCQMQYARTLLPSLLHPEATLTAICFHDTAEDHGMSYDEIRGVYPEDLAFGDQVADAVRRVTKKWRGQTYDEDELFASMAQCPIASVVKGGDRIHNLQSMVGVFTPDKQRRYLQETQDRMLPMLKHAERRFPEQEPAYKNIRTVLKMQITLLRHALG